MEWPVTVGGVYSEGTTTTEANDETNLLYGWWLHPVHYQDRRHWMRSTPASAMDVPRRPARSRFSRRLASIALSTAIVLSLILAITATQQVATPARAEAATEIAALRTTVR
jgi:hypothetical protein